MDGKLINHYTAQMILPSIKSTNSVLMLGLGNGQLAEMISEHCQLLTVVEGSEQLVTSAADSASGYNLVHSLFEEYEPDQPYDVIIGTHVLEHVTDPVAVIKKTRSWVGPNSTAIFTVPNQSSLHRRIGKNMGLLEHESNLNDSDVRLGHLRVYSRDQLVQDLSDGGFSDVTVDGYWLKMVPNRVMATWERDLLDAIFSVSKDIPADLCADLIATCRI